MWDHIRSAFSQHPSAETDSGRSGIAAGITLTMTPGHPSGHLSVSAASQGKRGFLLGDAIVCPIQLDEPTWRSIGDVDPGLAQRVRASATPFRDVDLSDVAGSTLVVQPLPGWSA